MNLLLLCPKGSTPPAGRPGVLWIHGGGYITGMPEMVYMSRAKNLVKKYGAVVVCPDYRLAGATPYPAALLDCHNALAYLKTHAAQLGVRDDQIMMGGESAGGGLTAALCMYEKDIGGIHIAFQMRLYPMLDNEEPNPPGTTTRRYGTPAAITMAGRAIFAASAKNRFPPMPRLPAARTILGFPRRIAS